ncbi:MAG: hypothetical protein ACFFBD_26280 [Candidatus Hodarchaeota archaeon]
MENIFLLKMKFYRLVLFIVGIILICVSGLGTLVFLVYILDMILSQGTILPYNIVLGLIGLGLLFGLGTIGFFPYYLIDLDSDLKNIYKISVRTRNLSYEEQMKRREERKPICQKCGEQGINDKVGEHQCSRCGFHFCQSHITINENSKIMCIYCTEEIQKKNQGIKT